MDVNKYYTSNKKRLLYKMEITQRKKKICKSTIEVLSLYVDLGQRKVSEFENCYN